MRGPPPVRGVVDVDRVDPDQGRVLPGQPCGPGLGEEVRVLRVSGGAEPGVIAGVQQHGSAPDIECGQGADVDAPSLRSGDPDHHGGHAGGSSSPIAARSAPPG